MLGGGGFTSPGVPTSGTIGPTGPFTPGYNIRFLILPAPDNRIRIDAFPTGENGEIQWANSDRFWGDRRLRWIDAHSRLEVEGIVNAQEYRVENVILAREVGGKIDLTNIREINGVPYPVITYPAGEDGEIQFNDDHKFGATDQLKWDDQNNQLYAYRIATEYLNVTNSVSAAEYFVGTVPFAASAYGGGIMLSNIATINGLPYGPAGAQGQIQFNAGGSPAAFGASAGLTWDDVGNQLTVSGTAADYTGAAGEAIVTIFGQTSTPTISTEIRFGIANSYPNYAWITGRTSGAGVGNAIALNPSGGVVSIGSPSSTFGYALYVQGNGSSTNVAQFYTGTNSVETRIALGANWSPSGFGATGTYLRIYTDNWQQRAQIDSTGLTVNGNIVTTNLGGFPTSDQGVAMRYGSWPTTGGPDLMSGQIICSDFSVGWQQFLPLQIQGNPLYLNSLSGGNVWIAAGYTIPFPSTQLNVTIGGGSGYTTTHLNLGTSGSLQDQAVGAINFFHGWAATANGNGDGRIAFIQGVPGANSNDGYLSFQTAAAGVLAERMRIDEQGNVTVSGNITCDSTIFGGNLIITGVFTAIPSGVYLQPPNIIMPTLLSADPGVGSKQIWYDPSDGNRVKYSP
jgi:hypothetical protein